MNDTLTLNRPRTDVSSWRMPARRPWHWPRTVDVVTAIAGLGLGVTIALCSKAENHSARRDFPLLQPYK